MKRTPIEIIAAVMKAVEIAAKWIGSVEWRGRFRKRTEQGIEALTVVSEQHQAAITDLAEANAQLLERIEKLELTMSQNKGV